MIARSSWIAVRVKAFVHFSYRVAWALLALTALFLMCASTPAVATWLQRCVAVSSADLDASQYPPADAIVVLGGGEIVPEGDVSRWDSDATRLGLGRALLQAGRAPVILLSGGDGEARQMTEHLIAQGVPQIRIYTENRSRTTRENALYSAPILRRLGAHRVLLVTSGIHMRRASACFSKLGFQVLPAPARELPLMKSGEFWQVRERALVRSGHCLHEILGLWLYDLCGWA